MIIDRPKAMSAPPQPWNAQEEAAIVARAREGDAEAIGQLYRRHARGIYGYLASRVATRLSARTSPPRSLSAPWRACRTTSNAAPPSPPGSIASPTTAWPTTYVGGRSGPPCPGRAAGGRTDTVRQGPLVQEGFAQQVDARLGDEQLATAMAAAIAQLTPEQQQVIALRFYADLKLAEIAFVMDKSTEAIKMLQCRALMRLRELVGQSG